MAQPGCTRVAISQLLLSVPKPNLVGRKPTCYFIIKFSLLLSIRLCWSEQACVFGSCAFNKHSVLKIFMINGLNFKTV